MTSCVQRAASAAPGENSSSVELAGHRQVVVAGEADVGVLARERDSSRWGRRRSRRGRPGTRSPRAGLRCDVGEHRLEGVAVAVDVGDDGDLHGSRGRLGRGAFFTNVERPRRVAVAVVAAFVVAEAAVLLLRPRDGVIEPVPVDPGSYFTPARARARARLPPRPAGALRRRHGDRGGAARVARAPPAGAAARALPAAGARGGGRRRGALGGPGRGPAAGRRDQPPALGRRRPLDPGLGAVAGRRRPSRRRSGRSSPASAPRPRSALMRRFPRRWWVPGQRRSPSASRRPASTWARSSSTRSSTASRRCPRAARAATCSTLAREAGVEVGQVYEVDASRRTTAANAYVTGLGRDQARRPLRHPARGLHPRRGPPRRRPRARPRALPRRAARPALPRARGARRALRRRAAHATPGAGRAARPVPRRCRRWRSRSRSSSFGVTVVANQLSRRDRGARGQLLAAPDRRAGAVHRLRARHRAAQRRRPRPARLARPALLGTHPTTVERIGIAKAFEAARAALGGSRSARQRPVIGRCDRSAPRRPWRRRSSDYYPSVRSAGAGGVPAAGGRRTRAGS